MPTPYSMGPLERVLYLRTVGVFGELGASMLAAIAQHSREQFFVRGTAVTDPGQPLRSIQFVVDGRVELTGIGDVASEVGVGAVIGLVELLAQSALPMGAVAVEDTRTLELDWDTLLDVWDRHFPIVETCLRQFSREVIGLRDPVANASGEVGTTDELAPWPLRLPDRVQALLSVGSFRDGHPDGLVDLARQVAPLEVPAGRSLWAPGDPADHFLVLTSGEVEHDPGGRAFGTSAMATVGLYEMLAGDVRTETVVARRTLRALRVDREPFLDMIEDHFEMALDLLGHLAHLLLSRPVAQPAARAPAA